MLSVFALATCGGCAGLIWFVFPVEEPLTAADRAVLLTIEDVEPFLEKEVDPARATTKRLRQPGRVKVNYEYDATGVLVATELESSPDARSGMRAFSPVLLNLAGGKDARFSELKGVLDRGDESKVFLLTKTSTGAKIGNIVVVRQGRRLVTWTIVGVYVDDEASVDKLFGEKLDALESWTDTPP